MIHCKSTLAIAGIVIFAITSTLANAWQSSSNVELTLKQVREIRELDLVKADDNGFSMDQPGLALSYELSLPQNKLLLEIHQPDQEQVHAVDSSGKDLSDVPMSFMNKREFVKMIQTYGEPLKEFTFHLAAPTRNADNFNLRVNLEAVTFTSLKDFTTNVTGEWVDIDSPIFDSENVQIKVVKKSNSIELEMRPGTIKPTIESVELYNGSEKLETSFSMWSDSQISYSFTGKFAENMTVKFKLRTGLSTETISIKLDDQPLP